MSEIAKGGRGLKAPYTTTHFRIPEPLKPLVSAIAEQYRERVQSVDDIYDETLIRRSAQAVVGGSGNTNEKVLNELLSLRAEVHRLKLRQIVVTNILQDAVKMHNSHGSAIKKKIKEALKIDYPTPED